MNIVEFEDLLDRLGEDLSTWPDVSRAAAKDLLASSEEAQALYDEALLLRRSFAGPSLSAPEGLADRISLKAAQAPQVANPRSLPAPVRDKVRHPQAKWSISRLAFAACFLFGIVVGSYPHLVQTEANSVDFQTFLLYVVDGSRGSAPR